MTAYSHFRRIRKDISILTNKGLDMLASRESLVVNNNSIYHNMSRTEYDADNFFEKKSYFSNVMQSGIKIRIFGTQLLPL